MVDLFDTLAGPLRQKEAEVQVTVLLAREGVADPDEVATDTALTEYPLCFRHRFPLGCQDLQAASARIWVQH